MRNGLKLIFSPRDRIGRKDFFIGNIGAAVLSVIITGVFIVLPSFIPIGSTENETSSWGGIKRSEVRP